MTKLLSLIFLLLLSFTLWAQKTPEKTALMIIDMQDYFISRGGNSELEQNAKKISAIYVELKKLIAQAKESNRPIIMVEYKDVGPSSIILKKELVDYKKIHYVTKDEDGAFDDPLSKAEIEKIMLNSGSDTLVITGANGGACVEDTIQGSIRQKYKTIAVTNAIADFNFTEYIYPYTFYTGYDIELLDTEEAMEQMTFDNEKAINSLARQDKKEVSPSPVKIAPSSQVLAQ